MWNSVPELLCVTSLLGVGLGCAARIDRFTLDKVVPTAAAVGDTGKVCTMGESLAHPLTSLSSKPPSKAMVVAEGVAALCLEQRAWEAELDAARIKANFSALGAPVAAEITDAALRAERAHAGAAARFERSFAQHTAVWGEPGTGTCPEIKTSDEFTYLFGLVTGTLSLIHDRKSGGVHDIPLDRLLVVARASECLDGSSWWYVPEALAAGAYATIPGSAPAGVDPWAELERAASAGQTSGVRVSRAIQVLIGANSGVDDVVTDSVHAFEASLSETPRSEDWALLDAYAHEVALHESDLLWTAHAGHRTESFGVLPADVPAATPVDDPFAEGNPFGGDAPADNPFATGDDAGPAHEPEAPTDPEETP